MIIFWVIFAAIVGMALSIVVTQLAGSIWNWKAFWAAFIPGAMNAAAWAVKQALGGDLMTDIIMAVIGGFGLSTAISYAVALKAIRNQVLTMQNKGQK